MDFVVFTLFPNMFQGVLSDSIMRRALDAGAVSVRLVNFRDFATDKHRTVDDYPFGGGAGMLLKPAPLFDAVHAIRNQIAEAPSGMSGTHADGRSATVSESHSEPHVVLLSPQGRPFTQQVATELSEKQCIFLLCGHYEGFDERVRTHLATDEISLGDFVLTGGEIAAMAVMDAVVRLLPGVLGNNQSADHDSFTDNLLEYPQYTRPAVYRDIEVPSVLLSGDHARVDAWRHRHSLYRTWRRRPDLLQHANLTSQDNLLIARWETGDFSDIEVQ